MQCYVETYPGIWLGLGGEWVSHNIRGSGVLELAVVLPFLSFKTEVRLHPRKALT